LNDRPFDAGIERAAVQEQQCGICGKAMAPLGHRFGQYARRDFLLVHCPGCRFSSVADPWTDYETIYSADYYRGRGADPSVDYAFELEHPGETVRRYEWEGLLRAVSSLLALAPQTRWLDFGCGGGGLVRHVARRAPCLIVGHERGHIGAQATAAGIPLVTTGELAEQSGSFDVITAIEVIEHVVDPLELLRSLRRLLKPGGLLFLTTGNARPFRGRLLRWSYVVPEVHVSYFEPETLETAMRLAGFEAERRGFLPGFDGIIRFKVLKSLGVRRRSLLERLLPWPLLARVVDARLSVTAHPIAWVPPRKALAPR
jgi:2-polyprenyl-3-methyl-5-hydroxy-6-metoxy-1,4-benzoquinol methylase